MAHRTLAQPLFLAARLPWWAALLSAGAAYALLHLITGLQPLVVDRGTGVAVDALAGLLFAAARIGQYLVPLALLILAAASAILAWRHRGASTEGDDPDRAAPTFDWASPPSQDSEIADMDAQTTAAAEALAALIRAEERPGAKAGPASIAADRSQSAVRRAQTARGAGERSPGPAGVFSRRGGRPDPRRVLDAIGMVGAFALLWAGWQWFAGLPAAPAASPLAPLTTSIDGSEDGATGAGPSAVAAGERPLGEYRFGPRPPPAETADVRSPPTAPEQAPEPAVVPPLSPQALADAFEAAYIPPPECSGWHSNVDIVRCGNHRMRSLRAFIDSGGRLPQAGEPGGATAAGEDMRTRSWRQEQALGDAQRPDSGVVEQDGATIGWSPRREPEPIPIQRPDAPAVGERPIPSLSWRDEQARREGRWGDPNRGRLTVMPEDAGGDGEDWRDQWLQAPSPDPQSDGRGDDWRRP